MALQERRLTVPAVLEKIEAACEFVSEAAREVGMADDAVYHCYLAVEEVCTNIVEHGYGYNGQHEVIEVIVKPIANRLKIVIIDDAKQFNPLHLSDPDPTAPLMDRKSGGWGVFFVKKFMDRVDYRYADNRNQFIMEKQL